MPAMSRGGRRARKAPKNAAFLFFATTALAEVSSVSRVYHDVCIRNGMEYWNYQSFPPPSSVPQMNCETYEIIRRLGSGKFSEVMEAVDVRDGHLVALKILKPVQAKKIEREICICARLAGGPNIIRIEGVCRDDRTEVTTLVLEHLGEGACWLSDAPRAINPSSANAAASPETHAGPEVARMSGLEIRHFVYRLLQALDFCHSRGIMHRDVKPRNVVINRATGELRLIDWGLGEFYLPAKRYTPHIGSRYYKAPELLFGYRFYDYAVDIFGAGCVLAGLLFRREPFFHGRNNDDQLVKIARVLGTDGLERCLQRYGVELEAPLREALGKHDRRPWGSFVTPETAALCTPEALDLVDQMLCWNQEERISAAEALQHPFFDPVRAAEAGARLGAGG